jgi:thiol-disulfide isomerase/thioredoxin
MSAPTLPDDIDIEEIAAPYDEALDLHAALDQAFEHAKSGGKRVLVKLGGAWCPDCRIMAGMMAIPAVEAFLHTHYEIVTGSIGRYDRNSDVVERLGFSNGLPGAPTLLVITPAGEVVNRDTADRWRTAREQSPQDVVDYFADMHTRQADAADRVAIHQED